MEHGDEIESAEITRGELLEIFGALFKNVNPTDLIEYIEKRAGLLFAREDGIFSFPHRTFQEFLSACYVLNYSKDYTRELFQLLEEDYEWWREVYLLSVGRLKARMESSAIGLINAYLPQTIEEKEQNGIDEQDWRKAVLASEALIELRLINEPDFIQDYSYLIKRSRDWLTVLIRQGKLEPKERLRAGDMLGNIGDFRKGVNVITKNDIIYPNIDWVRIPEGEFLMGSLEEDKEAYSNEKKQHPLYLPEFWISRYPITNAQYEPFIKEGYQNSEWWSDEGWDWRNGKNSNLTEIKDKQLRKIYKSQLKRRPIEKRDQPFWHDEKPWNGNNRPVVGVCWFEVYAYTQWLTEIANAYELYSEYGVEGFQISLPSEAEWEKAARGEDGKIFPWGNEWKNDAANISETQLFTTSVTGMFSKGKSRPYGLLDCAGNIWEWTRTIWGIDNRKSEFDYEYPINDSRENINSWAFRVLRGGSWSLNARYARCALRDGDLPVLASGNVGFRIILSRSSSDA